MADVAADPWTTALMGNQRSASSAAPAPSAATAPADAPADPWVAALSGKAPPKAAPKPEGGGALPYVNNLVRQAANAASLGTADYVDAGLAALGNSASNLWNGRSADLGG